MKATSFDKWIKVHQPKFQNLTGAVVSIVKNLLSDANIDFLAVNGRTKSETDCSEKVTRKQYKDPIKQLTDISGVRIIVYFENDIDKVSKIIENSFKVFKEHSLDKDNLLSANEFGYRSVHYVCDIGEARSALPEFSGLKDLKFEFQIRTVLQHAWAELAHDRNYKFSGELPRAMERKLYLFAGMLELADKGFSELSHDIDEYQRSVSMAAEEGSLDIEINSLSLELFVRQWITKSGLKFEDIEVRDGYQSLLDELDQFEIYTLDDLNNLVPDKYIEYANQKKFVTIYGVVRDWMIISDPQKFLDRVEVDWVFSADDFPLLKQYIDDAMLDKLETVIGFDYDEDHAKEWDSYDEGDEPSQSDLP
ncbi:GTP pyrophosphokinase [Phyllobacterium bourgognense]|uniref:PpGpp synthetase/RelA/SpoT-type nucleotidyltransferase n=1 Tax=Phyllobacterium bourgognense TaxID=314236 RepID=A0A368Z638_9HYPH|nr:GTP pyrophosphokinase [Phyllobacterium bourgognense]RCW87419.1 ppGpp synthetase/RelA/SpoT-type nucleotidyltransferase [Phyllobacterium bourgognense]